MNLINLNKPVDLQLSRNLTKVIKRGHSWVYSDALRYIPDVPPGTPAILHDNRGGREIARGYLDPSGSIAFRVCSTQPTLPLNNSWADDTMQRAYNLRKSLFSPFISTNAYRLFNGEGDGLPGLVCDVYDTSAVILTDGNAPKNFWQVKAISQWLADYIGIDDVFYKDRDNFPDHTNQVFGNPGNPNIMFQENGLKFTADLIHGQKTGFFLDQRDNRALIKQISENKRVLNVFGYTGGFSVYAGAGKAEYVTTLDSSAPALKVADYHWRNNHLPVDRHNSICADAFEFLSTAVKSVNHWDLTIIDPPSFASSEANVPKAVKAYTKLITMGVQVTSSRGFLAASSCSSHIPIDQFLQIIEESVSIARRKSLLIGNYGQPPDHPSPLTMPELRYLKFVLLQLD